MIKARVQGIRLLNQILSLRREFNVCAIMAGPVESSIRLKISSKLAPVHLDVINESYMHNVPKGSESHFKVVVVSSQFENITPIQRHRMIHDALSEEFTNGLHALSIVAKTPSQWSDSDKKLFHSEAIIDLTNEEVGDTSFNGDSIPKSPFIVKRIEHLLGRGSQAQGFHSPPRKPSESLSNLESNPMKVHILESVPVVKLVKEDFIAQLPLTSKTQAMAGKNGPVECSKSVSKDQSIYGESNSLNEADCVDASIKHKAMFPLALQRGEALNDKTQMALCNNICLDDKKKEIKDGNYFLSVLDQRVKILESIANDCDDNISLCDIEESKGELRSVAGQSRLLIGEKFKQFRGLCHKNLSKSETDAYMTTNEDLQGFWDMISIQFEDLLLKYEGTKAMKENNWEMPLKKVSKAKPAVRNQPLKVPPLKTIQPVRPPQLTKTKPSSFTSEQSQAIKARELERKQMIMKRRLAMKKLPTEPTIKIN